MDNYEKEMLEIIDSDVNLTERQLRELVFEFKVVDRRYGENRRWSRTNTYVVEIGERYFSINWEEGLTENQENEFYEQPVEVMRKTYEKIITVTEWVKKQEQNNEGKEDVE